MVFDPFDDGDLQEELLNSTENTQETSDIDVNFVETKDDLIAEHSGEALGNFSTQPNIFGGQDYYVNNQRVLYSQPNIFGGQDFYGSHVTDDSSINSENEMVDYQNNDDSGLLVETAGNTDFVDLDYAESKIDFEFTSYDGYANYNYDDSGCLHLVDWVGELWDKIYYTLFSNPMYIDDIEQFDVYNTEADRVVGHPERSLELWEYQGETSRCALFSQKFIIEELTGEYVDIEEIAELAEMNGWFSEDYGTSPWDMNKILDYYGIPSELSDGNSFEDLKLALESGKRVIVAIDSEEIWYGEQDGMFSPLDSADHAVEVVGIDYSDPHDPKVILNDSGNSVSGKGALIPKEKFIDSWNDSNNIMVVA